MWVSITVRFAAPLAIIAAIICANATVSPADQPAFAL
jgi:hypothetical protein